jgi:ribonucleoside-triphosphate reductase
MQKEEILVKKKKKGIVEPFEETKIWRAIRKAADRVFQCISDAECAEVVKKVVSGISKSEVTVKELHVLVENALRDCRHPEIYEAYRMYRNYKTDAIKQMEAADKKVIELEYKADRSNANTDSALVSTKRSILYTEQQKERYKRIFLKPDEEEANRDGYIYIHDLGSRLDTFNCCLTDVGTILKSGFTLATIDYTEPGSVESAIAVLSDIMSVTSGNQYGGNTAPNVDEVMAPYCEKSYTYWLGQYKEIISEAAGEIDEERADKYAESRVRREISQGLQGIEHTFNSVSSCRGDYPFITFTFGHSVSRWGRVFAEEILKTRKEGQGKPGSKVPVVFPKLVFLYDSELHGPGKELEYLFDLAVECTKVAQYPDYLSLDAGYIGDIWKKWGKIISPMGCRAFLSPVFKISGTPEPADDPREEFVLYRCNLGVISLNLPMIYMKAKTEEKPFYEVLDYYMEMIRDIHKRTVAYLGKLKASASPLAFCEGGLEGGHLKPDECIAPVLKYSTISYGYGGLNELGILATGKSLRESQDFPLQVLQYISDKIGEYKKEDHILYALYGTPGESWLPLACKQTVKKYGEIPGVTDWGYFSNSFHCHVSEDITPIEKMEIEEKFWNIPLGGRIMYCRVPDTTNTKGIKDLIRLAMSKGLYYGVNHAENHCASCGSHWVGDDEADNDDTPCPECGSHEVVKIRRMNGYLSYTRTKAGKSRFNEMKDKEIRERKSM